MRLLLFLFSSAAATVFGLSRHVEPATPRAATSARATVTRDRAEVSPEDSEDAADPEAPVAKAPGPEPPGLEVPHPSCAPANGKAVVRGWIVDESGAPVPNAEFYLPRRRGCWGHPRSEAGYARDGSFVYWLTRPGVPPGLLAPPPARPYPADPEEPSSYRFRVRADGFIPEWVAVDSGTAWHLERGESRAGARMVLQRAAVVSGRLLKPDGTPAAELRVGVVEDPAELSPGVVCATTDAHGCFRIENVDPRRRGWLAVGRGKFVLRPHELRGLRGGAETWTPDLIVEEANRVKVRVEVVPAPVGLKYRIGFRERGDLEGGSIRARIKAGPQSVQLLDEDNNVVKAAMFWVEPGATEHYVLLGLDE